MRVLNYQSEVNPMNPEDGKRKAHAKALTPRLTEMVSNMEGFGLIVFFWLFILSALSGMVLLYAGWVHLNPYVFLGGMLSVRFFVYLTRIGSELLNRFDPSDQ